MEGGVFCLHCEESDSVRGPAEPARVREGQGDSAPRRGVPGLLPGMQGLRLGWGVTYSRSAGSPSRGGGGPPGLDGTQPAVPVGGEAYSQAGQEQVLCPTSQQFYTVVTVPPGKT